MITHNTDKLRREVAAHVAADTIIQGDYWNEETQRGCFIGCLARSNDPADNEAEYGLPVMVQRIAENIFEALPADEAKRFFAALPDAVGCDGKDLTGALSFFPTDHPPAHEKAPCYHDRGQVSHSELHQLALNLSTALSTNTPDPLVPASSCTPPVAHATARAAHHPAGARSDPAPPHQAPPANPASDHTQTSTHHHLAPLHHAADPSSHQRATKLPAASRWPCQRAAHPIALQQPVDQRPTAHQRLLLSAPLPLPP